MVSKGRIIRSAAAPSGWAAAGSIQGGGKQNMGLFHCVLFSFLVFLITGVFFVSFGVSGDCCERGFVTARGRSGWFRVLSSIWMAQDS